VGWRPCDPDDRPVQVLARHRTVRRDEARAARAGARRQPVTRGRTRDADDADGRAPRGVARRGAVVTEDAAVGRGFPVAERTRARRELVDLSVARHERELAGRAFPERREIAHADAEIALRAGGVAAANERGDLRPA